MSDFTGRLIGLTGFARSGKDEVAKALARRGWARVAFADPLRDMLYALNPIVVPPIRVQHLVDELGWDRAKENYPEVRQLLQRLGTDAGRTVLGENVWVDAGIRTAEDHLARGARGVVFTDVRFDNELEAIQSRGGRIAYIARPGVTAVNDHPSEALAQQLEKGVRHPDVRLWNGGTLEQLAADVLWALA